MHRTFQQETDDEEPSSEEDNVESDAEDGAGNDLEDHQLVRDGDGTIEKGAFTPVPVYDVLVGLDPQAFGVDGSLNIHVQLFDPEEISPPLSDNEDVEEVGPFFEISSSQPRVWGPQPGMWVVLPVPEDLDTDQIAAMTRSHAGTEPAGWTETMEEGTYIEQHGVFVVEASQLGAHSRPTQIGVVERSDASTDSDETFEDVLPSQFDTD